MNDEPPHEESDDCWCQPYTDVVEADDGAVYFIIVHHRITEPNKSNIGEN